MAECLRRRFSDSVFLLPFSGVQVPTKRTGTRRTRPSLVRARGKLQGKYSHRIHQRSYGQWQKEALFDLLGIDDMFPTQIVQLVDKHGHGEVQELLLQCRGLETTKNDGFIFVWYTEQSPTQQESWYSHCQYMQWRARCAFLRNGC